MPNHTPTPWRVQSGEVVADVMNYRGEVISDATVAKAHREPECPIRPSERDDNMKWIVTCVNACAGLESLNGVSLKDLLERCYDRLLVLAGMEYFHFNEDAETAAVIEQIYKLLEVPDEK
jgi:hypothetical protein